MEPNNQINLDEQALRLPWLIVKKNNELKSSDNSLPYLLLVSCPDGTVLEFDLPENAANQLEDILKDHKIWKTFFTSLVASFKIQNFVKTL